MARSTGHSGSILKRSLGLQGILLLFGITIVMVGASTVISTRMDNATMQKRLEENSIEISGLLRLSIDKPMIVGDDQGTSREFVFLSQKFPNTRISIASFTGSLTYSTDPGDVRKNIKDMHRAGMSSEDRANYLEIYSRALRGETSQGSLLTMNGNRKFLHVSPIYNAPECYHCHGSSQKVLGAMAVFNDVEEEIAAARAGNVRNLAASIASALLLAFCIYMFMKKRIINRLESIAKTSDTIVGGDFNARFTVSGEDELGRLAANLGNMLASLKKLGTARSVLFGMSVPGVVCDLNGQVTFLTKALLDILSDPRKPKETHGAYADELLYGRRNPRSIFATVLGDGRPVQNQEEDILSREGKTLNVRLDAVPVFDLEKNLMGVFCSVTDLTAIRKNEADIIEKNKTIHAAAQEAGGITSEIGAAVRALDEQVKVTRIQANEQQTLSDSTVGELEDINNAMGHMTQSATLAAEHAHETRESAENGAAQARNVMSHMENLVSSTTRLKARMEELGAKTAGIIRIMQVIKDIADQTNLLALNAAIEAARAGDAGKGFAVVADEVRKLAEKTMQATVEVGRTIDEVRASAESNIRAVEETTGTVEESSEQVKLTGDALHTILNLAESVAAEVQSIASAVEQQSVSTGKARNSILDIRHLSENTITATAEIETAVQSLMGTSESLNKLITGMTREK